MTSPLGTPPWVWSEAAYTRALALNVGSDGALATFAGLCFYCGLPTAQFRPSRDARSWSVTCSRCSVRAFVRNPRLLFAASAILNPLRSRGLQALGDGIQRIERMGVALEAISPWDEVLFGSTRKLQLRTPVACLFCGEVASASARRDRYGLAYVSCEACVSRSFFRTDHCLRMALGWTAFLATPGATDAWMSAYHEGKTLWRGWLDVNRLDPAESAADTEVDAAKEVR
ncbi:hypothetical protein LBMAG42_55030 [Deltaproteobacteria bacterium]|nr:hypothetical protein LBMAG42_55030 [Deltaproteobacteria bacterium]